MKKRTDDLGKVILLTESEWLQLSVLAGEEMSISVYVVEVLRDHIKKNVHLNGTQDVKQYKT